MQEKSADDSTQLTTRMEVAREQMLDLLEGLNALQVSEGVQQFEDAKPSLNFGLAAVVYEWARGTPFARIAQMSLTQEGSIVRYAVIFRFRFLSSLFLTHTHTHTYYNPSFPSLYI